MWPSSPLWKERLQLQHGIVWLRLREREKFQVHTASEGRKRRRIEWWRERKQQEQSYAVMSTVFAALCSGLLELAPSGSALVVLRLRMPSVEPTLEAEWVLERTSRVIPAVGTGGWQKHQSVVRNRTHQCGAGWWVWVCVSMCPGCLTAGHS